MLSPSSQEQSHDVNVPPAVALSEVEHDDMPASILGCVLLVSVAVDRANPQRGGVDVSDRWATRRNERDCRSSLQSLAAVDRAGGGVGPCGGSGGPVHIAG